MESFRREVREWLSANLVGEFAELRGLGGPGREHEAFEGRLRWHRHLAAHGWTCLGWPGERSVEEQVVFHEEYAEADAPAKVDIVGEGLLGPTLIAFGTPEQKERFLPKIRSLDELWCQGYSEPGAGSDLASVQTRARLDGDQWVIDGQKIWTSNAHHSDWIFVLCRTEPGSQRHQGLSYLLVPMHQAGVEVRPIRQLTGTSEFNEVFFDGAVTARENVVGQPGEGWKVAMATLGFERGTAMLGHQVGFRRELDAIMADAPDRMREKLTRAWLELHVMRSHTLRTLNDEPGPEASVLKLFWGGWHRRLGELAMESLGPEAMLDGTAWRRMFLFSRAETIYGGSDEIQREIIAHRVLGLPR
ncbi:acyl-CoA dehydrogenase family protein [Lentzea nigeriaca]|uniref:acyl-CoA dehydrogenase family protein n=1 Tax=Lentzea nigeriaca TaxID=1128665 RepID=UPI0019562AD0|nr:acyl-CoA dehydrogenase family protein [Lentzea nigeriaca]MBM7858875.1 alkylation response protein AidB-like acyl-CoA dehydrogenase [Lentzea nigeriaca]